MKHALIFLTVVGIAATASAEQPNLESGETDGVTLASHLMQSRQLPERTMFWRNGASKAVRWKHWKLVRIHERPFELYDLSKNAAEDPKHDLIRNRSDIANELLGRLRRWEKGLDDK